MALTGVIGLIPGTFLGPDLCLGKAVILYQRNVAGADGCTTAALDAVEEIEILDLVEILRPSMPVHLLGQQIGGTGGRTAPATDAGHVLSGFFDLAAACHQDTVGPLDDRYLVTTQGKAHHRPAHDQPLGLFGIASSLRNKVADRCTDRDFEVAGFADATTRDGHDA